VRLRRSSASSPVNPAGTHFSGLSWQNWYPKVSKVIALVYPLCKVTIVQTFENVCRGVFGRLLVVVLVGGVHLGRSHVLRLHRVPRNSGKSVPFSNSLILWSTSLPRGLTFQNFCLHSRFLGVPPCILPVVRVGPREGPLVPPTVVVVGTPHGAMADRPPASTPHGLATTTTNLANTTTLAAVFARSL
jgi:hypothetical protein